MNAETSRSALFRQAFSADAVGARAARTALEPLLERMALPDATRHALLLAVAELVINPGQHAQPPASEVEVALIESGGRLRLELRDDGAPFTDFAACWGAEPDDPLAESGRGLALLAAQFPDAHYGADPDGRNLLVLDAGPAPVPRPRVLLVDDDLPTLRLLGHYLEDDYEIVACDSAEAALEALETQPVDLVISDIRMPGLDGIGLRRRLAERAGTDTLPFLFLTGRPENEAGLEGLAVDDYLIKPVSAERLRSVTQRVLARARQLRGRLDEQYGEALTSRLRPQLPEHLGAYRTSVRTAAAGHGGGDLLLEAPVSGGRLVVLADLMGHGTGAKLHAHTLAGYLHGLLDAPGSSWTPATLLQAVAGAFGEQGLLAETLATLIVAQLDDDGRVTLASAGHPSPWRIADAGIERLELDGPLPGLADEAGYPERHIELTPGERLLLYTDGLVERLGDRAAESTLVTALERALVDAQRLTINAAAEAAWTAWHYGVSDAPADDATLVLIERA